MSTLQKQSSNKVFDGTLTKYSFKSKALGNLDAKLNIFLPPQASESNPVPIIYYLAGLTCTEDNGAQKGGFFETASKEGIAICFPDTSPRGAKIEGEDESYDFGSGAGFYVNATKEPWNKHYNMYEHVVNEIPEKLREGKVPVDLSKASIFGHSMGGHGALTLYLREGDAKYKAASAFAPICHPTACPWGDKAFNGYLAGGLEEGKSYDATELIAKSEGKKLNILIDSGLADNFYESKQLLPEDFEAAARKAGHSEDAVTVRLREGYDHSYFFIASFGPDHVRWHAKILKA
ncbi:unnamed protein product [Parajaminaea phylloscopi]